MPCRLLERGPHPIRPGCRQAIAAGADRGVDWQPWRPATSVPGVALNRVRKVESAGIQVWQRMAPQLRGHWPSSPGGGMAVESLAGSEVTAPLTVPATACRGACQDAIRPHSALPSRQDTLAGVGSVAVQTRTSALTPPPKRTSGGACRAGVLATIGRKLRMRS